MRAGQMRAGQRLPMSSPSVSNGRPVHRRPEEFDAFLRLAHLFAELLKGGPVTWQGKHRAPLHDQDVVPHTESGPFPAWIGIGGSPQSVLRAARYGYSLMLAIIGGNPARFASFSQLFTITPLGSPVEPEVRMRLPLSCREGRPLSGSVRGCPWIHRAAPSIRWGERLARAPVM
jgi:Luciferase-like monooxygenase